MTVTERRESAAAVERQPRAFIAEPTRINPLLRVVIGTIERAMKQRFVPGRLVAWSPRIALQWLLVPGGRPGRGLDRRILQLVAIAAAGAEGSPYCLAVNSGLRPAGLAAEEIQAVASGDDPALVPTFTDRERLAIGYARLASASPMRFPPEFIARLTAAFTEREIVVLAATAASINYNGRLIESLGAPAPVVHPHRRHAG